MAQASTSPCTILRPTLLLPSACLIRHAALCACAGLLMAFTQAATADPRRGRWDFALAEFAAADRQRPPEPGGVLFVGSSSIRLWDRLPQDFNQVPMVLNRGFGGSTLADCHQLVRQLVIRYQPRHVVLYAGENDLAEGRSPEQVQESLSGFVEALRSELPEARLTYISIKPSPLRAALLPKVRESNRLLAEYLASVPRASYVDVFTPMLDATGAPRAELFGADRLHMNGDGYALWRAALAQHVEVQPPVPAPTPAPTLTTADSSPPAAR